MMVPLWLLVVLCYLLIVGDDSPLEACVVFVIWLMLG